jgi:hypothetical protein
MVKDDSRGKTTEGGRMSVQTINRNRLGGSRLTIARILWIVFALTLTVLQVLSLGGAVREFGNVDLTAAQRQGLQAMGLSRESYSALKFFWQLPNPIVWGGLGLLIFLRKSNDRGALILSAMMVGIGMATSIPTWREFDAAYPGWSWLVPIVAFVGNLCIFSFFFVFPTGRYVPRWTVGLALVLSAFNILTSYDFALPVSVVLSGKISDLFFPVFALASLAGITLAPVYRYRRVSTPIEREQIKWVVFTIVVAFVCFVATASTVFLVPDGNPEQDVSFTTLFIQPLGWVGALLLIPLSIAVSIFRYRLFDIDVIIRRTVTYALVTALLVIVFFGSVILLQQIFSGITGSGQDEIVTVLSTLAIAALFVPLRRRIQNLIDRRFNRNRYDAQQVLHDFANTVRDETDLGKLTARLMQVVDETMQPRSVSLWLKNPNDTTKQRRG